MRNGARSASSSAGRSGIDDLQPDALVALALALGLHDPDAADLVGACARGCRRRPACRGRRCRRRGSRAPTRGSGSPSCGSGPRPRRPRRGAGSRPRSAGPAASSALTSSSIRGPKPSGSGSNSKSMRADSGSMFPPVTGTRHSFQITPHSTCSAVWVRMSAWRRSQSIDAVRPWCPIAGSGAPSARVCHTRSPSLRTSTTGDAVERAGVVRLPAAGRVEGRAVEGDGAVALVDDDGVHLPQVGVAQVQQLGGHRPILPTPAAAPTRPAASCIRLAHMLERAAPSLGCDCSRRRSSASSPPPATRARRSRRPARRSPASTTTTPPRSNVDGELRHRHAAARHRRRRPALGPSLLAGVRLAVQQINDAGGVQRQARSCSPRRTRRATRPRRPKPSSGCVDPGPRRRHHRAGVVDRVTHCAPRAARRRHG